MTHIPGGRRRVDRMLEPAYLDGLTGLEASDLARRREEAQAEEQELSYVRRLLQGRLDVLRAEQQLRARGQSSLGAPHTDAELVAALSEVLADHPTPGRAARMAETSAPQHHEQRRAAEVAVADVRSSDPSGLDDVQLAAVIAHFEDLEAQVSATRRALFSVLDALTAEIQRRIASGEMAPDPSLT